MEMWNPWHGCRRISPGCSHCYVFEKDIRYGRDTRKVEKTGSFDLPIRKKRDGTFRLQEKGLIFTCGTSDFFIEEADAWRQEAWKMIRSRPDQQFLIITKRIHRIMECLPPDWGEGYANVYLGCTCENQDRLEFRMPYFLQAPLCHRLVIMEPMLEAMQAEAFLARGGIEEVVCGGESGEEGRVLDFGWVLQMMQQCVKWDVNFSFHQTGAHFKKGEKVYTIQRKDQMLQAQKAGIDYKNGIT